MRGSPSTCSKRRATRISAHWDFSEDTYRTLTAVDSAVMVLEAAKGTEDQTRKRFEVCRLRDVPIITFVNKLDREARDPFDLLDEIERIPALDLAPDSWPIGKGRDFLGTYDLFADARLLLSRKAWFESRAGLEIAKHAFEHRLHKCLLLYVRTMFLRRARDRFGKIPGRRQRRSSWWDGAQRRFYECRLTGS